LSVICSFAFLGEKMALKVKKFHPDAILPNVAHPGLDLGYDLFSVEDVTIPPLGLVKVHTGVGIEITNMKVGVLIKDRSSMGAKGIHVFGGVVDAGYRGEIMVLLYNASTTGEYEIKKGDKIAQMIPLPTLTRMPVVEVQELEDSERGDGGFGSTENRIIVPKLSI
jgi:dUTP pyrophosphatase